MRTFEHAKSTDHLGRYYTARFVSQLLVDCLPARERSSLLDLGAGEGALSLAASARWKALDLLTVDVDGTASAVLADTLRLSGFAGRHHHVQHDALAVDLWHHVSDDFCTRPDLAVCNPPFQIPRWRKGFSEIVEDAGFSGSLPAVTTTDAALLFLSQNLRLLDAGGTVGIIVPDSLVSAAKYLPFRKTLLSAYALQEAIRLPRQCFAGTDALAHILVLTKSQPSSDFVTLSTLASPHSERVSLTVSREQAAERLDYEYHCAGRVRAATTLSLADITLDLRRGSFNSAQVRESRSLILHTTDIKEPLRGIWFDFSAQRRQEDQSPDTCVVAKTGDILVARVGRNAAGKVIGICNGHVAISDCLFRLRVQPEQRMLAMQSLISRQGTAWLDSHAYGVAARQLSKADLLRLPLQTV